MSKPMTFRELLRESTFHDWSLPIFVESESLGRVAIKAVREVYVDREEDDELTEDEDETQQPVALVILIDE